MEINFDAIRQDIPIQSVFAMFGKAYKEKGKFSCVSKDHVDKSPSMMIIQKSNRCYCYSCGAVFDPVDLAKQELNCTTYEAVEFLLENLNMDKSYYITKEEDFKDSEMKPFPFKEEQMTQLGLSMNYTFRVVSGDDFKIIMEGSSMVEQDKGLTKKLTPEEIQKEIIFQERLTLSNPSGRENINMVRLFHENEEEFYDIVQMSLAKRICELKDTKTLVEQEFSKLKAAFIRSGEKPLRVKVVRRFLDYIKSNSEAGYPPMNEKESAILKAYLLLYDTHDTLKNVDESIEIIKSMTDEIPDRYRTDIFKEQQSQENQIFELDEEEQEIER